MEASLLLRVILDAQVCCLGGFLELKEKVEIFFLCRFFAAFYSWKLGLWSPLVASLQIGKAKSESKRQLEARHPPNKTLR